MGGRQTRKEEGESLFKEQGNFWKASLRWGTKMETLCDQNMWWDLAEEERSLKKGKYNEAVVRAIVFKHQ